MIKKTYTDEEGYKHVTLCAPDDEPHEGIHQDPPIVGHIDWHEVERKLHNRLIDTGLLNWRDVQGGIPLTGIIVSVLKPEIVRIYKLSEKGEI